MSNKKLFFYLNTENPEQSDLLAFYEKERNKTQTVRDGLSLIFELRKLNNSLPELLKTVLQNSGSIADIRAIFDVVEGLNKNVITPVEKEHSLSNDTESQHLSIRKNQEINNNQSINNARKIFGKGKK